MMLACSAPQSTAPSRRCARSPVQIGMVNCVSLFMKISAARNSFHEVMKAKRTTVTMPAFTTGRNTRQQHLEAVAAVDHRRFLELVRHSLEGVAHQVDAEGQLQERVDDGEAEMGVGESELAEHQVERRQQRLIGDHHARKQQEEPRLFARHLEAGESIARRDREDQAEDDGERRHADAVGEVRRQARLEMVDLVVVGDG